MVVDFGNETRLQYIFKIWNCSKIVLILNSCKNNVLSIKLLLKHIFNWLHYFILHYFYLTIIIFIKFLNTSKLCLISYLLCSFLRESKHWQQTVYNTSLTKHKQFRTFPPSRRSPEKHRKPHFSPARKISESPKVSGK